MELSSVYLVCLVFDILVVKCWKSYAFKFSMSFFSHRCFLFFPIFILCALSEKIWWKRRVWLNRWSRKMLLANVLFPHFSLGKRNFPNQFNNDESKSMNHAKDIQKWEIRSNYFFSCIFFILFCFSFCFDYFFFVPIYWISVVSVFVVCHVMNIIW